MARVLPYPWSLTAPRSNLGGSFSMEDCEVADPFNPETVTFLTRMGEEPLPCLQGHHEPASLHSSQVVLNPRAEAGQRHGVFSIPVLLPEASSSWQVRIGGNKWNLPLAGTMRRAGDWEEPSKHNADEVSLRDAVDSLTGYFREAVALTHDRDHLDFSEFSNEAIVRLDWKSIWQRWKKVSTGHEPRMARVVEIALTQLGRIRDVCERPRRMLVRQREHVSLGRVQELDAACLRDLFLRPGRTVPEKAGARQEILAVTRRETVDTAENRIIRDFIRLCQSRARVYERENTRMQNHRKVRAVIDLRQTCERLDARSPIAEVGRLAGVARPNYVLQKDRRYHPLWLQYDRLRREQEAVDDIWSKGRILWAEFVRGVVMGFLLSDECRDLCGFEQDDRTLAYVRSEHQSGYFLPALSISSCLKSRDGRTRMLVIHPKDAHRCPGVGEFLPRLGAELAIAFYPDNGRLEKPSALLCIHSVLSLRTSVEQQRAMIVDLQSSLDHLAATHPDIKIHGLLLRGMWPSTAVPVSTPHGRLEYLAAPAAGPFWFLEFPELLAILIKEVGE